MLITTVLFVDQPGPKAEEGTSWISNHLVDRSDADQDGQHPANPAKEASAPDIYCVK